jgi:hypothetical protein
MPGNYQFWPESTLLEIRVLRGFFTNTYKTLPYSVFHALKNPKRFFQKPKKGFSKNLSRCEKPFRFFKKPLEVFNRVKNPIG